jgi:hypothetical protein
MRKMIRKHRKTSRLILFFKLFFWFFSWLCANYVSFIIFPSAALKSNDESHDVVIAVFFLFILGRRPTFPATNLYFELPKMLSRGRFARQRTHRIGVGESTERHLLPMKEGIANKILLAIFRKDPTAAFYFSLTAKQGINFKTRVPEG